MRKYTASAFVIDFETEEILLMYNEKLQKYLQPGGHIEGIELPNETAVRETLEETGININIIGKYTEEIIQPFNIAHYKNLVGDMIDFQYCAIPKNKELNSKENKQCFWININDNNVPKDIKQKADYLIKNYKKYLERRNYGLKRNI